MKVMVPMLFLQQTLADGQQAETANEEQENDG